MMGALADNEFSAAERERLEHIARSLGLGP
jgi:hypothetical protein